MGLLVLILGFVAFSALVVTSQQPPRELDQRRQVEMLGSIVGTE